MDKKQFSDTDIQTRSHDKRSTAIGEILVESGVLKRGDLPRILKYQSEHRVAFGLAAQQLGLIADADIQHALAVQYEFPSQISQGFVRPEMVVAESPAHPVSESIRGLRSQLMLRWLGQPGHKNLLAVTSVQRGEGRTFIAANLAISFAQMHMHTLLVDLNLRNPSLLGFFGADGATGAAPFLAGRERVLNLHRPAAFPELAVLPAGHPPPNPQELLLGAGLPVFLNGMSSRFDVIIIDTPAASMGSDAQVIAARAGAAILVSGPNCSSVNEASGFVTELVQSGVNVVGAVANRY